MVAKETDTKRQKRGRVIGGTDVRTNTEFPEYGAIWDQGNELRILAKKLNLFLSFCKFVLDVRGQGKPGLWCSNS